VHRKHGNRNAAVELVQQLGKILAKYAAPIAMGRL